MEKGERKRMRVSQACDQCRRRKDRCDSGRPKCKPCTKAGRSCTYNPSTKKRGLPTGYVRAIETLLGLVFHSIDGCEEMLHQLMLSDGGNPLSQCAAAITARDSTASELLLNAWRKSNVLKEVDRLLIASETLDDEEDAIQNSENGNGIAPPDDLNVGVEENTATLLELPKYKILAYTAPSKSDIPMIGFPDLQPVKKEDAPRPGTAFSIELPATNFTDLSPLAITSPRDLAVQLPSQWSQLLDIHFANTHSWFPISRKQDLLRPAYLLANGTSTSNPNSTSGEIAFLWAALANSLHQTEKSGKDNYDAGLIPRSETTFLQLAANAGALLPADLRNYEIGHLRALLLLTLLHMDMQSWTAAWSLVGRAVYVAVELGMPACPKENLSKQAGAILDEGQRRAFLGCFALDALASARLNRRPCLRHYDLHSIGAIQVDGIEEWEPWRPSSFSGGNSMNQDAYIPGHVLSIFNQFVNLMGLLNDSLCVKGHSAEEINLSALVASYDRWEMMLPVHCRLSPSASSNTSAQETPMLLNLALASECLHQVLKPRSAIDQIGLVHNDSTGRSYQRVESLIVAQMNLFGSSWVPPTFETLLYCCRRSLGTNQFLFEDISSNELQIGSGNLLPQIQPGSNSGRHTSRDSGPNSKGAATTFTFNPDVLSPVTNFTPPKTSNSLSGNSKEYQEQPDSFTNFASNTLDFTGDIDFDGIAGSLTSDTGDDALFDSLAMLDPVDWSATQPEFLRNLGLTSNSMPVQFQSFFNSESFS